MKATLRDISSVKKTLLIEIDAEEVDKKLSRAFGDIGKRARIPGFRPGKAPRKILEAYFGAKIKDDVAQDLISESLPRAMEETKAFPLSQPILEREVLKAGEPFVYSAIMEVRPEFEVTNHIGVPVEREILEVTEEDVQKRVEEIRTANGKLISVAERRPIRERDYVIVDYQAFENGQPIREIQSSNFLLRIGNHDFHPRFDEALLGRSRDDEIEVVIDFEKDFYHALLAGKRVAFKVRIVDVKELALPELNDEFAKSLGPEFGDLEALKREVRKAMTTEEERRIDRELKQRIMDRIAEGLHFDLPEVLVQAETEFSLQRFKENLKRSGASIQKMGLSEERLQKDFRSASEKRVREMLILEQIAQQEKITVTDEDLEEGYRDLAQRLGQQVETVKRLYEVQGRVDHLKNELLREKTLDYLAERAMITEVPRDALTQKTEYQKGVG